MIKNRTFLFAYFLLLSGLALAYTSYHYYQSFLLEDAQSALIQAVNHKKEQIAQETQDKITQVINVSKDPIFITILANFPTQSDISPEIRKKLTEWFSQNLKNINYYDFFLINPQGLVLFSLNKQEYFRQNILNQPYITADLGRSVETALMTVSPDISFFTETFTKDKPSFFITIPIIAQNKMYGFLAIEVNPSYIFDILDDFTGLDDSCEILYAQEQNQAFRVISIPRHHGALSFQQNSFLTFDNTPLVSAAEGSSGAGIYDEKIAAFSYQANTNAGIAITMPVAEALAPSYFLLMICYGLIAALVLLTLFMLYHKRLSLEQSLLLWQSIKTDLSNNSKTILLFILTIVSGAGIFFTLMSWYGYKKIDLALQQKQTNQTLVALRYITQNINRELYDVQEAVKEIVDILEKKGYQEQSIEEKITIALTKDTGIGNIKIAYEPFAYSDQKRLWGYYWKLSSNKLEKRPIDQIYDYTRVTTTGKKSSDWYVQTLEEGAQWHEPYFDEEMGTEVIAYSMPFYSKNDKKRSKPLGIISATYPLKNVGEIVQETEQKGLGQIVIINQNGEFIYHPSTKLILSSATIFDVEKQMPPAQINSDVLKEVLSTYLLGLSTQNATFHSELISLTGWVVGALFVKESYQASALLLNQSILIIVSLLLLLIGAIAYFMFSYNRPGILLASAATALLIIGNGVLFTLIYNRNPNDLGLGVIIQNKAKLKSFIRELSLKAAGINQPKPIELPTGIQIKTLYFPSENSVLFRASLWQKYPINNERLPIPKENMPPIIKITNAQKISYQEVLRKTEDNFLLIAWDIECTIDQPFDYSLYPFNTKKIVIALEYKDEMANILVAPDLGDYAISEENRFPWLEKNLLIPGFSIQNSFFSYDPSQTTTNQVEMESILTPPLNLVIDLKNLLIDSFMGYILPLIVGFIAIFSLLWLAREQRIPALLGIIFTIVMLQRNLRSSIAIKEIIFLEYFFFCIYVTMIVMIIYVTFLLREKENVLGEKTVPYIKMLYWPVQLIAWMAVAIITFYK